MTPNQNLHIKENVVLTPFLMFFGTVHFLSLRGELGTRLLDMCVIAKVTSSTWRWNEIFKLPLVDVRKSNKTQYRGVSIYVSFFLCHKFLFSTFYERLRDFLAATLKLTKSRNLYLVLFLCQIFFMSYFQNGPYDINGDPPVSYYLLLP